MKVLKANSKWFKESDLRLDAEFHLSEGPATKRLIKKSGIKTVPLTKVASSIFSGKIFKRTYVNNPNRGIPYLTASDMAKFEINSGNYLSRKFSNQKKELFIKKGWILLSCSGTLGNTVFTNEDFEGIIGTHDLIRIIPDKTEILPGYLYAFLSSKYGYALLTQSSYGGVVKHIEPHHIEHISVPIINKKAETSINSLIEDSARLRHESTECLKKAHKLLNTYLNISESKKLVNAVSIKEIKKSYTQRFEANYFLSKGDLYQRKIKNDFKSEALEDIASDIFRPGIFKRIYVKDGVPFLGGAELMKYIPKGEKQLSKTKTENLSELMVNKDWVLVTCGGTIGLTRIVDSEMENFAFSQHILRIVCEKISPRFLYAFLTSEIGKKSIEKYTYGSVIPQIEPHHIGKIRIPILKPAQINNIITLIDKHIEAQEESKRKETKAIDIIEKEIESWQK